MECVGKPGVTDVGLTSLIEKFPSLSKFLNEVQKTGLRRDDEVVGTVSEWCDNVFAELSSADSVE